MPFFHFALRQHTPSSIAVSVISEVLKGLAFLHDNQIVHRDVKPSAIFLTKKGRVVLADFDIAKPLYDNSLTLKGTIIGSPRYMSPEQRLAENTTGKSDIYSTGVTLYEMLTGDTPWRDINRLPTDGRSWASIKPPSKLFQDIPPKLDDIVLKAVYYSPGKRFDTADKMLSKLGEIHYASQTDLIAWASGRKRNINLNPESHRNEDDVKNKKSTTERNSSETNRASNKKHVKQPKKKTGLWTGIISAFLILLGVAGMFIWRSLNSNRVFFQDDFSDPQKTSNQWVQSSGDWQIINESYYCSTLDNKCLSIANSAPEENFSLSVDFYGQDGVDKSVYFGISDQQYYRVSIRSNPTNQIIFSKINKNQSEEILSEISEQINNKNWYQLKVVIEAQTISIYLDEKLISSTTNPNVQPFGGNVGIGVEAVSIGESKVNSAAFDNFEIMLGQ
jgi:serine/threonine protein kinase